MHFFWGGPDLAVTRFSGRTAPKHPGGVPHCADWVQELAYSHEVSSCGFWPGGSAEGSFYSYAYPQPAGFADWPVVPDAAYYDEAMGEFLLPYAAVRTADDPDAILLSFFESTYEGAATLGGWDRAALEVALVMSVTHGGLRPWPSGRTHPSRCSSLPSTGRPSASPRASNPTFTPLLLSPWPERVLAFLQLAESQRPRRHSRRLGQPPDLDRREAVDFDAGPELRALLHHCSGVDDTVGAEHAAVTDDRARLDDRSGADPTAGGSSRRVPRLRRRR